MSADQSKSPGENQATAWITGVIAMLLIYILSPPPLGWLMEKAGIEPPEWFQFVYAPLIFAYNSFEPVEKFYDAYGSLLGVEM